MSEQDKVKTRPFVADILFDENRCCDPLECPFAKVDPHSSLQNTCRLHCISHGTETVYQLMQITELCKHTEDTFYQSLKAYFASQEIHDNLRHCGECRFAHLDELTSLNKCMLPRDINQDGIKTYYFIGPRFICCHKKYSFEVAIDDYRAFLASVKV
jgi:hypothetical protein